MLNFFCQFWFQRLLIKPVAGRISNKCLPNYITFLSCLLGIAVFPALIEGSRFLATVLLLLSGYCDSLDGALARIKNTRSHLGAVLDIVSDRIVEFTAILALFALDPLHRAWAAILMLGSCLICVSTFLVIGIFSVNTSEKQFYYSPGLIERPESFIFFILMIWLPDYFISLSALFIALVLLTVFLHIKKFAGSCCAQINPNKCSS